MIHRTGESAEAVIGHPAVTPDALWVLTDLALHCEHAELQRELEILLSSVHLTSNAGIPLTETEKLLDEALWYLRARDFDEATYRVEQAEDAYKEATHTHEDEDDE